MTSWSEQPYGNLLHPLLFGCVNKAGFLPSGRVMLSHALKRYYEPLRLPLQPNAISFPYIHLLGVLATQTGNNEAVVELLKEAIHKNNNSPEAYYNLGNALSESGDLTGAETAYRQAIKLKGDFVAAYFICLMEGFVMRLQHMLQK